MLVTKALSQDVMVLAFVPLFADPRGVAQPSPQSTYMHCIRFNKISFQPSDGGPKSIRNTCMAHHHIVELISFTLSASLRALQEVTSLHFLMIRLFFKILL